MLVMLTELKKLCDEATPGPWFNGSWSGQCYLPHFPHGRQAAEPCKYEYTTQSNPRYVSALGIPGMELITSDDWGPILSQADAAFIVAARTMLPKLIAVAEAAKNEALSWHEELCNQAESAQRQDAWNQLDAALAELEGQQ